MRTCIAATRKVNHVFIYTYKLKVSGAHAPLGPTVDTPLFMPPGIATPLLKFHLIMTLHM